MKTDSSLSPPDDDNRGMVMLSLVIAAVYGAVVASFDSAVPPRDARITAQIERLLAAR